MTQNAAYTEHRTLPRGETHQQAEDRLAALLHPNTFVGRVRESFARTARTNHIAQVAFFHLASKVTHRCKADQLTLDLSRPSQAAPRAPKAR